MKKRALLKDFLREIHHTRSRFLSILILVALSVAFLSGLRATAPDMKHTGDDYLDALHLADVQVLSTLGLTDADLSALMDSGYFQDGEGAYVLDAYASADDAQDLTAKVYSLSERGINDVLLRFGRMPQADDECVADENLLAGLGIDLGDTITLMPGASLSDALKQNRYTVVGTIRSPVYLSLERGSSTLGSGTVHSYVYLPRGAFALDFYTAAFLRVKGAAEMTAFYEDYDDTVDAVIDALEPLADTRAQLRYDEIVDDARAKVEQAQRELDDARAEADRELGRAERELADARRTLNDGWAEVGAAEQTLARETASARQKLTDARRELDDGLAQLSEGEDAYAEGLSQYEDGLRDYREGLSKYEDGRAEYEDGLAAYQDGLRRLEEAKAQLDEAEKQLADAQQELERNQALMDAMAYLLFGMDSDALYDGLTDGSISAAEVDRRLDEARELLDVAIERGQALLGEMDEAQLQELLDEILAQLPEVPEELQEMIDALPDKARLQELLDTAIERRSELDGLGTAEFLSAMEQLRDGWAQFEDAQAQLARGREEYEDGKKQLEDAEAELLSAEAQLAEAETELKDAKTQLDEAALELADARKELDEGWDEYRDGLAQYESGRQELAEQTASAEEEIADGKRSLSEGEAEYKSGLAEYTAARREAEEQLADGEQKLLDARRRISEIEHGSWYLLSRSYNPGYTGFGQDADRMGNLASVFPMIFFLVAALVCLTTMTRMVDEQRIQIGALKALGYSRLEISMKYIGYGLLPALLGSILGLVIGYTLFPSMIFTAYQIMYEMPDIELRSYPDISAFSVIAAVACTTLSTLWACISTLRETPASLMRPRTPKAGKRVFLEYIKPLWRRMKFIHKVTARNLFRYQKRFWMTVIGIGGCTALIIAGFGLRSSLMFTMTRQFDELFHYTAQVSLLESILPEDRASVERFIETDPRVVHAVPCTMTSATAAAAHYSTSVYLEAVEADELPTAVELLDSRTGEPIRMQDDGVYIDQKLSELLNVRVGDTFLLDAGTRADVTVAGIFEHYAAHFVYMTPACYARVFAEPAAANGYLLTLASGDSSFCDEVFSELMQFGSVSASRMSATRDTYLHSMERIDFVVVIVILAAAALAMVVLYNLSNINITERQRELATIKLLGFFDREVSAYVYRENIVLTLLGIALGILLGHVLHMWLVHSVEIDLMMFGRRTDPMSYLYASLLTALFSLLVNLLAHVKMKKINMVESLKSAE